MTRSPMLARVAVAGPLRRSFTYHIAPEDEIPSKGQRLLVEFGRKRTVGFYLGEGEVPRGVKTKPVIGTLDPVSYIPPDLYELCVWMADYYFANPADCLACALPAPLRTRQPTYWRWADKQPDQMSSDVASFFRPGKRISSGQLDTLHRLRSGLKAELVRSGAVIEEWPAVKTETGTRIAGYRVADLKGWDSFFRRRKFRPESFEGKQDKASLEAAGWTDYYLRQALAARILEPVHTERGDDILSFVTPKPGVADLVPNEEQQAAIDAMLDRLDGGFGATLLHGVTGSGKTLVYCHVAREVLERGRSVLVMTPEIALSGATLAYFRGFFGDRVTVIHSAMTPRERLESWNGIRRGRYRIVVGPRSALFAPLVDPGLIIVDEEHDSSYKQVDPSPRFQGRDSAVMRARINNVPVLLGSASPSLESFHHARTGRYQLLSLSQRPESARLPRVTVIDLKSQRLRGDTPYLSFKLKKQIDTCLEREKQAILFLNRRGYSPQLKCAECGHVPGCPHCEIKLTFHKSGRKLSCHYCGYAVGGYDVCEKCGSNRFLFPGTGTQKVEEHVARLFERGRVLRFDSDTASGRKNAHQLLREFAEHKHNLLLGTQMVTKGLDLPEVTLVGVLSADIGIDLPDFRANERTFSRLLQVAGRSGRGRDPGDVYIQTYYPESDVIQEAARQDYLAFYEREIESRRSLAFPPFGRLLRFVLSSPDRTRADKASREFAAELKNRADIKGLDIDLLGPTDCPIPQLRGQSRRHLIVKTTRPMPLLRMLTEWEAEQARFGLPSKAKISIDVDPEDMM
jgi:primosomal protein N' (replication factor Y)